MFILTKLINISNVFLLFLYFAPFCIFCSNALVNNNNKRNNGFFWQLTDIHWDFDYSENGLVNEMCHKNNNSKVETNVGYYGNYLCDAPWTLVHSSLLAMKKFYSHPDFILWTGDNAPHTGGMATFPIIFEAFRNLTKEMKLIFGTSIPLVPVLGNHDTYPKDNYPDSNDAFYERYLNEADLKGLLPPDSLESFQNGGYYKYKINSKFYVLVLNTNLYYSYNTQGRGVKDPSGQFEWMERQFENIRNSGKKAFVTAHAPPGYWERSPSKPFFNVSYNDRYVEIINKYGDVIVGQFYGHLHTDSFRIFGTNYDSLKSSAFISPSVSPWYPTRLVGGTGINPSIRLYSYNNSTVLDYVQYNMNLTEANNNSDKICSSDNRDCEPKKSPWRVYYRATELFGIESLDPENLVIIFKKLFSNDTLFQDYYKMNSAGYDQKYCNATCKRIYLCAISHLKINSIFKCLNQSGASSSSQLNLSLSHLNLNHKLNKLDVSSPSFITSSVAMAITATVVTILIVVGLLLIVSAVRRKKILESSSLPEFEWMNRHHGYRPLRVDDE